MTMALGTSFIPNIFCMSYSGSRPFTGELLNVLKEEKVRATFFVLGTNMDHDRSSTRRLLKRMWNEGHDIGSHTYSHTDLTTMSDEQIIWEMEKTDEIIRDAIGVYPVAMRPPYGTIDWRTCRLLNGLRYNVVNWNIDSDDWKCPPDFPGHVAGMIPKRCSRNWESSYIILQHDTHKWTVEAARAIIKDIRSKGYKFVNLSECLGDLSLYRKKRPE